MSIVFIGHWTLYIFYWIKVIFKLPFAASLSDICIYIYIYSGIVKIPQTKYFSIINQKYVIGYNQLPKASNIQLCKHTAMINRKRIIIEYSLSVDHCIYVHTYIYMYIYIKYKYKA